MDDGWLLPDLMKEIMCSHYSLYFLLILRANGPSVLSSESIKILVTLEPVVSERKIGELLKRRKEGTRSNCNFNVPQRHAWQNESDKNTKRRKQINAYIGRFHTNSLVEVILTFSTAYVVALDRNPSRCNGIWNIDALTRFSGNGFYFIWCCSVYIFFSFFFLSAVIFSFT